MKVVKAPCRDCPDRKVGCHSQCEKYKEYYHANEELKQIKQSTDDAYRFSFDVSRHEVEYFRRHKRK